GGFLGFNYATNNFLGFGESLQLSAQGGTRQSDFVLSFTEPYLMDHALSAGFSVYARKLTYDQNSQLVALSSAGLPSELGLSNALNFQENRKGFSLYSSYPVKLFQRFGLTYQLENTDTTAISPATQDYFAAVASLERARFVTSGGAFSTFRS